MIAATAGNLCKTYAHPYLRTSLLVSSVTSHLFQLFEFQVVKSRYGSPLCPERQVLPEADARVQHSLQEALSCPVRDPVICLLLARLKPCIPCSDGFQRFPHPRKHAVNPALWHQDLQPLLR